MGRTVTFLLNVTAGLVQALVADSVTMYVRTELVTGKTWLTHIPLSLELPSPKFQAYVTGVVPEAVAVKATVWPTRGAEGEKAKSTPLTVTHTKLNVAVTTLSPFMRIEIGLAVPLAAPLQPVNVELVSAVAVSQTVAPAG